MVDFDEERVDSNDIEPVVHDSTSDVDTGLEGNNRLSRDVKNSPLDYDIYNEATTTVGSSTLADTLLSMQKCANWAFLKKFTNVNSVITTDTSATSNVYDSKSLNELPVVPDVYYLALEKITDAPIRAGTLTSCTGCNDRYLLGEEYTCKLDNNDYMEL